MSIHCRAGFLVVGGLVMAELPQKPKARKIELFSNFLPSPDQSPFPGLQCMAMSPFDFSPFPSFTPDPTPLQCTKLLLPGLAFDSQPVPVNPLQYHRILKRRVARSKLKPYVRNRDRTYVHESRHKHAVNRLRGPQGKFLSKEELERKQKKKVGRFSAICEEMSPSEEKSQS